MLIEISCPHKLSLNFKFAKESPSKFLKNESNLLMKQIFPLFRTKKFLNTIQKFTCKETLNSLVISIFSYPFLLRIIFLKRASSQDSVGTDRITRKKVTVFFFSYSDSLAFYEDTVQSDKLTHLINSYNKLITILKTHI